LHSLPFPTAVYSEDHRGFSQQQSDHRGDGSMSINFYVWEDHWQTGRRHKVSVASWPGPSQDAADEVTKFAIEYYARWHADPHMPDHPVRDKDGKIILPASLDTSPLEYLEASEPAAQPREPAPVLPYAGPMVINASPVNSDVRAVYERSRRGLGKSILVKPPVPPHETPTPQAKGFTPSTPAAPPIAPRWFEPDKNHPKYSKPGTRR
jgi:hypothetical protein